LSVVPLGVKQLLLSLHRVKFSDGSKRLQKSSTGITEFMEEDHEKGEYAWNDGGCRAFVRSSYFVALVTSEGVGAVR
jgi:hypothetical protein